MPRATLLLLSLAILAACSTPAAGSPSPDADPTASAAEATATATPPDPSATSTATPQPLAWSALPATGPAAREDHTWTVDGEGKFAYLFGGRDGGGAAFDDLWAYDLATDAWSEVNDENPPPARFGHETVWVDGIGLVVFAGQVGTSFFNDLWAYDPNANAWTQLPSSGAVPVARYGSCAAVGLDERLWISHGFTADQVRFDDTRAYDFATGNWTDETPDGLRPFIRCLHGCWWTDAGELALYGGQTTGATAVDDRWLLVDEAWSQVSGTLPPARNLYARTRLDGATLVFGGQGADGSYLGDLWLLVDGDADARSLEAGGDAPPGRSGAELIRDGDRVLLFGGRDAGDAFADVWELRGGFAAG